MFVVHRMVGYKQIYFVTLNFFRLRLSKYMKKTYLDISC